MFTVASKLSQKISKYNSKNKEKNINCDESLPLIAAIALGVEMGLNSREIITLV